MNRPDSLPHLKSNVVIGWIMFLVGFVTRLVGPFMAALGALLMGLFQRIGWPQFNKEYIQMAIFDDNFALLGYLFCAHSNMFIYGLIFLHGYLTMGKIAGNQAGLNGISSKIINFGPLYRHLMGVNQNMAQLLQSRYDFEIYLAVASIPLAMVGMVGLLSVLMIWQLLRIRYVSSYGIQQAFQRFDGNVKTYLLTKSWCPGFVRSGYNTVKSFCSSQI